MWRFWGDESEPISVLTSLPCFSSASGLHLITAWAGFIAIHTWFYNLCLCACGILHTAVTKPSIPWKGFAQWDKNNPLSSKGANARSKGANGPPRLSGPKTLLTSMAMLQSISGHTNTFQLRSTEHLRSQLRRHVGKGINLGLDTNGLDVETRLALKMRLRSTEDTFHHLTQDHPNVHSAILDSGASWTAINNPSLVVPGTLCKLDTPIALDGIAGGHLVEHTGEINMETLDRHGNPFQIRATVMVNEELPCILVSPQALLQETASSVDDHFRIYADRVEWHVDNDHLLNLEYDSSFLPRLPMFPAGQSEPTLKAFFSVFHQTNQNLSPWKKLWLKWHVRLNHLSFSHVKSLGSRGYLDKKALSLSDVNVNDPPMCRACKHGRQTRTPDGSTITTKNPDCIGNLKKEKLTPGQTVFCDQLESRVRGRLLHTAGREPESEKFCGTTVFCDAASGYIHVEHQVTLNASDTINSKLAFERKAMELGVSVSSYHTDNGIFKSQAFTNEIVNNHQSIRFSGVGAKWQNGAAEGAIGLVSAKARTLMLHADLMWPEAKDDSLWPLAVSHAAHLYNHTPNELTGISPAEVFTQTQDDYKTLRNAHPWGCPVYVLEPKLTSAGGKIPKWQPRSRRAQFVGISPNHAEDIALVRNLNTGRLSPQFHVVFDEWFETCYSSESAEPSNWADMCIYSKDFATVFDESMDPPDLADEWLTDSELEHKRALRRRQHRLSGRRLYQDLHTKELKEDLSYTAPPPDPVHTPKLREPPDPPRETPLKIETAGNSSPNWKREPPDATQSMRPTAPIVNVSAPSPNMNKNLPVQSSRPKRSEAARTRNHMQVSWNSKSYDSPKTAHLSILAAALALTNPLATTAPGLHHLTLQSQGMDPFTGTHEFNHPGILQAPFALEALDNPMAFKAKMSKDPDLPSVQESLTGPHAEEFWKAMDKEIASLEKMGTWEIIDRSSLPKGATVVPGTWAQRIKRYPDGRLNKFKSRWCVRGDLERHSFTGNAYSPLVGWPTVRASLLLAASHGWTSRQVDFSNAFCQSPQKRDVFVELPQYYRPEGCDNRDVVLRLKKSLYGQLDSPKLFYEHLCKGMTKLGFVPSESDPCLFMHKTEKIMVLNYCDDQIWLSPDNSLIEKYVGQLQGNGYDLTLEPEGNIFGFLGIEFEQSKSGPTMKLSQKGLIQKVINYTAMNKATPRETPAAQEPLGSDKDGEPFNEEWSYPAAVGMLLYLSSNTRPDIQFAVHQVARFTHNPKRSHGQALKRIIRYLIHSPDEGIRFTPNLSEGLNCYVDADFAGLWGHEDEQDPVSVRSRTGFTLTLFGCPIIWKSVLQTEQTLSTLAAEYVAFSTSMRELIPMRALLNEMGTKLDLDYVKTSVVRSTVFEDNQGCLSLVNVPKMSPRNKYLALKYHFFRSHIGEEKGVVAKYISTDLQKADIFTKGLPPDKFKAIRKLLMGW